ncbi:MAG TPA: TetR/AcrR family transcriptional regulator [Burkholderiaceae bacterium]|nr:TetR/AcrR family transcriptional regulator [Burkholderiaceae bacterium]
MRARRTVTSAPPPPESGPRARTYRLLIDSAMRLMQRGGLVTVAEVAADAGVSRATAYRYFPSRSKLVTAVVDESLGPARTFATQETDGRARLTDLFVKTFPRLKEFEPQLRAALQLALEHWALERSGRLEEEPFRRGHRMQLLDRAARPLREQLGVARYNRLLHALSLVYGIEPYIVLKDMWAASDRDVEAVSRWVLDALIAAALKEAAHDARNGGADGARQHSRRAGKRSVVRAGATLGGRGAAGAERAVARRALPVR